MAKENKNEPKSNETENETASLLKKVEGMSQEQFEEMKQGVRNVFSLARVQFVNNAPNDEQGIVNIVNLKLVLFKFLNENGPKNN